MAALLAWLPFLIAITVAFASGVVFAREAHGRALTWPHLRRTGDREEHVRHIDALHATVLFALLLALTGIWIFVAALLLHIR
jgi:hypothetical protein